MTPPPAHAAPKKASPGPLPAANGMRLAMLDTARGAALLSMVAFHLAYDLVYLFDVDWPWFRSVWGDLWQASIGWSFVFIAGCSASLSRNTGLRACKLALVALGITCATAVARVDIPVYFGVIHCLALCTAVLSVAKPVVDRMPPAPAAAASLVAALATAHLSDGYLGIPGVASIALPEVLYRIDALSFLGLPGPTFASGDYFPLLPYLCVYLAGYFGFRSLAPRASVARLLAKNPVPPLAFAGRHSMAVYLAHQVVLLGALALVFAAIR